VACVLYSALMTRLHTLTLVAIPIALLLAACSTGGSPTPLPTRVAPADGMVQVEVPAGDFLMGSAASGGGVQPDESPQHRVTIDDFWIDRVEVTNAMYALCVKAGQCSVPGRRVGNSPINDYYGKAQYDTYPVVNVAWTDALSYCLWAGGRLPTEAEWEKAARGNDGRTYPWGNDPPAATLVNYCDSSCALSWKEKTFDDGHADLAPVGSYPAGASPYGALDMAGNAWEWVADWYSDSYYASASGDNPQGPADGQYRVVRGGSWDNVSVGVRTTFRAFSGPDTGNVDTGFRCVR
jgi:formylglycine-generating enzyme required for sulfatase activity